MKNNEINKRSWAKKRSNRVKGIALLLVALITIGAVVGVLTGIIISNTVRQESSVEEPLVKLNLSVEIPIPEVIHMNTAFSFSYVATWTWTNAFGTEAYFVLYMELIDSIIIGNYISDDIDTNLTVWAEDMYLLSNTSDPVNLEDTGEFGFASKKYSHAYVQYPLGYIGVGYSEYTFQIDMLVRPTFPPDFDGKTGLAITAWIESEG